VQAIAIPTTCRGHAAVSPVAQSAPSPRPTTMNQACDSSNPRGSPRCQRGPQIRRCVTRTAGDDANAAGTKGARPPFIASLPQSRRARAHSDERSHGLADQCDAGARPVGHTAHQRGGGAQRRIAPPPGTYVIAPLFYIYDTDTSGRETAIDFRSTRESRALRWRAALTSLLPGRFSVATTASRYCFPSGRTTGFRVRRSTRILAGA
jgi:hypothetical protein